MIRLLIFFSTLLFMSCAPTPTPENLAKLDKENADCKEKCGSREAYPIHSFWQQCICNTEVIK